MSGSQPAERPTDDNDLDSVRSGHGCVLSIAMADGSLPGHRRRVTINKTDTAVGPEGEELGSMAWETSLA